jgi:hypothetical protein
MTKLVNYEREYQTEYKAYTNKFGTDSLGKTEGLNNESNFILPEVCLPEVLAFSEQTLVLFFWVDIHYLSHTLYDT